MNKDLVWKTIPAVLIIFSLLAGVFLYQQKININQSKQKIAANSPALLPSSPTPTSVADEKIDLTKYNIEILNGSGITGEAAKVKTVLEKEGFKVADIGNADNSSQEETIIQVSKEVPELFVKDLKTLLEKTYTIKEPEAAIETKNIQVIVIIGSKKAF